MKVAGFEMPRLTKRWALGGVLACALTAGWYASAVGRSRPVSDFMLRFDVQTQSMPIGQTRERTPEDYLLQTRDALARADYTLALALTEQLVSVYPHFQAGQWLYAQLLALSTDAVEPTASSEAAPAHGAEQKAVALQTELARRVRALLHKPETGSVPAGVQQLAGNSAYLAVVDASISRMYVFKTRPAAGRPLQMQLLFDTYASVGINGIHKQIEGDGRSPVGVYFTQKRIPDQRLPDLYGAGALTLDYPNALDVHMGRSGSGIWIHGTPSAQYSRAPQASDGCIVLPNDSMRRLLSLDNPKGMPVFIQAKIDWVSPSHTDALSQGLNEQVQARYGTQLLAQDSAQGPSGQWFSWQDQAQRMALVDLQLTTGEALRTYWQHDGTQWRFVSSSRQASPHS
jgi:L,D-peptidoglycan transpeptidase YkuD (ErfK/YbiS/YcfS/YnhG family)